MDADPDLDDVLAKVADGEPVDWDRLPPSALNDQSRPWLEALRVLDEVATLHRAPLGAGSGVNAPAKHERWGKYLLQERLGTGGFGEVFRAWDPSLKRDVAIKLLHLGLSDGSNVEGRVLSEGQRLASVRHQNIVSVFEVEQHGGRPALCMEFIRGRTLEDVVRLEGPLNAIEAARVGAAVCGALSAVHDAGLVHRDVKANNVMREHSGRIVLMDFGSGVRWMGTGHSAPLSVGTPLYMAPELFNGGAASPSSDVYSVGVLLYFLATGQYPVDTTTLEAVKSAHATHAIRPLRRIAPELPKDFVAAVDRAINSAPEVRHRTAKTLSDDLEKVLASLARRRAAAAMVMLAAGALLGIFFTLVILGFLTSATYTYLLGLSDTFISEGWRDYFVWGRRSLVAPVAMAGLVTGFLYLVLESFALAQKVSAGFRRLVELIKRATRRMLPDLQMEVRDRARIAVIGSFLFLAWVPTLGFPELVGAFLLTPLATAPDEAMRVLGPPGMAVQDLYRQTLSLAVTLMCAVWMALRREARRLGRPLGAAGWLGLGCVVCTLVLMDVPYRILYHNQAERARFATAECYLTGRSEQSALLFCPKLSPRVFSVNHTDPRLTRLGTFGSIFETVQ